MRNPSPLLVFAILSALSAACGDDGGHSHDPVPEGDGSGEVGDTDMIDYACTGPTPQPGACLDPLTAYVESVGAAHVSEPEPISYEYDPPSSGPHRPNWAKWGEYEYLPPQRWLHNLEHGGVALLYDPCADDAVVDSLREFARARPDDDGGVFRWVLTPYPGLDTVWAAVTWENVLSGDCFDGAAIGAFVDAWYRTAPEARDGSYDRLWLGR